MSKLPTRLSARAVLKVTVGESVIHRLARAQSSMQALQQGKRPKPHFSVGFAEVGQMLAVFTPKRWELIARLRETGPLTIADLARKLGRDYKNVHTDVAALCQWLALQRTDDGRVHVPWSEITVDMKLPSQFAA